MNCLVLPAVEHFIFFNEEKIVLIITHHLELLFLKFFVSNFLSSFLQLDVAVQEVKEGTPIKRLLLLLDLARQGQPEEQTAVPIASWIKVIRDLSL